MVILATLKELRAKIAKRIAKPLFLLETSTHVGYCTFVFIEAHGFYAIIAGALGIIIILSQIFGGE